MFAGSAFQLTTCCGIPTLVLMVLRQGIRSAAMYGSKLSLANPWRLCLNEITLNGKIERRQTMTDCPIKIYTLTTCGHCKNTKQLLDECGAKYDCVDVDKLVGDERAAILEEVKKYNPACSFPTILVGDKVIVGFREKEIKEAIES
jgi:glutaredoxin